MTILFGAAQGVASLKAEALAIHNAKTPRYHLRAGRDYLFYDGSRLTPVRDWAWVGTVEQAKVARKRFDAAAGCKLRAIQTIPTHVEEIQ